MAAYEIQLVQNTLCRMQKNLECPICLDLMKDPVSTRCDHQFCRFCILEVLNTKSSAPCPLCKKPVTKRSLTDNCKLNDIVTAVRGVVNAVKDDTGMECTPPRGPPIASQPSPKRQLQREENLNATDQIAGGPSRGQNKRKKNTRIAKKKKVESQSVCVYVEEDSESDSSRREIITTNTNISSAFPVPESSMTKKRRNTRRTRRDAIENASRDAQSANQGDLLLDLDNLVMQDMEVGGECGVNDSSGNENTRNDKVTANRQNSQAYRNRESDAQDRTTGAGQLTTEKENVFQPPLVAPPSHIVQTGAAPPDVDPYEFIPSQRTPKKKGRAAKRVKGSGANKRGHSSSGERPRKKPCVVVVSQRKGVREGAPGVESNGKVPVRDPVVQLEKVDNKLTANTALQQDDVPRDVSAVVAESQTGTVDEDGPLTCQSQEEVIIKRGTRSRERVEESDEKESSDVDDFCSTNRRSLNKSADKVFVNTYSKGLKHTKRKSAERIKNLEEMNKQRENADLDIPIDFDKFLEEDDDCPVDTRTLRSSKKNVVNQPNLCGGQKEVSATSANVIRIEGKAKKKKEKGRRKNSEFVLGSQDVIGHIIQNAVAESDGDQMQISSCGSDQDEDQNVTKDADVKGSATEVHKVDESIRNGQNHSVHVEADHKDEEFDGSTTESMEGKDDTDGEDVFHGTPKNVQCLSGNIPHSVPKADEFDGSTTESMDVRDGTDEEDGLDDTLTNTKPTSGPPDLPVTVEVTKVPGKRQKNCRQLRKSEKTVGGNSEARSGQTTGSNQVDHLTPDLTEPTHDEETARGKDDTNQTEQLSVIPESVSPGGRGNERPAGVTPLTVDARERPETGRGIPEDRNVAEDQSDKAQADQSDHEDEEVVDDDDDEDSDDDDLLPPGQDLDDSLIARGKRKSRETACASSKQIMLEQAIINASMEKSENIQLKERGKETKDKGLQSQDGLPGRSLEVKGSPTKPGNLGDQQSASGTTPLTCIPNTEDDDSVALNTKRKSRYSQGRSPVAAFSRSRVKSPAVKERTAGVGTRTGVKKQPTPQSGGSEQAVRSGSCDSERTVELFSNGSENTVDSPAAKNGQGGTNSGGKESKPQKKSVTSSVKNSGSSDFRSPVFPVQTLPKARGEARVPGDSETDKAAEKESLAPEADSGESMVPASMGASDSENGPTPVISVPRRRTRQTASVEQSAEKNDRGEGPLKEPGNNRMKLKRKRDNRSPADVVSSTSNASVAADSNVCEVYSISSSGTQKSQVSGTPQQKTRRGKLTEGHRKGSGKDGGGSGSRDKVNSNRRSQPNVDSEGAMTGENSLSILQNLAEADGKNAGSETKVAESAEDGEAATKGKGRVEEGGNSEDDGEAAENLAADTLRLFSNTEGQSLSGSKDMACREGDLVSSNGSDKSRDAGKAVSVTDKMEQVTHTVDTSDEEEEEDDDADGIIPPTPPVVPGGISEKLPSARLLKKRKHREDSSLDIVKKPALSVSTCMNTAKHHADETATTASEDDASQSILQGYEQDIDQAADEDINFISQFQEKSESPVRRKRKRRVARRLEDSDSEDEEMSSTEIDAILSESPFGPQPQKRVGEKTTGEEEEVCDPGVTEAEGHVSAEVIGQTMSVEVMGQTMSTDNCTTYCEEIEDKAHNSCEDYGSDSTQDSTTSRQLNLTSASSIQSSQGEVVSTQARAKMKEELHEIEAEMAKIKAAIAATDGGGRAARRDDQDADACPMDLDTDDGDRQGDTRPGNDGREIVGAKPCDDVGDKPCDSEGETSGDTDVSVNGDSDDDDICCSPLSPSPPPRVSPSKLASRSKGHLPDKVKEVDKLLGQLKTPLCEERTNRVMSPKTRKSGSNKQKKRPVVSDDSDDDLETTAAKAGPQPRKGTPTEKPNSQPRTQKKFTFSQKVPSKLNAQKRLNDSNATDREKVIGSSAPGRVDQKNHSQEKTKISPGSEVSRVGSRSLSSGSQAEGKTKAEFSFITTGLNQEELRDVDFVAKQMGCRRLPKFTSGTTHVIVKTDGKLVCERTLKYFFGIAARTWVVSFNWILACIEAGKILPEEPYEVLGDVVNGPHHMGPRRARKNTGKLLLSNYEICCMGSFTSLTTSQFRSLVELTGASIVHHPSMFSFDPEKIPVIIMQPDANTDEVNYNSIYRKFRAVVASREWIFDSIAPYSLRPLAEYLLCDVPENHVDEIINLDSDSGSELF